ncbi:hypothetical protein ILUMI_04118, partial [Ignelater luminosus]
GMSDSQCSIPTTKDYSSKDSDDSVADPTYELHQDSTSKLEDGDILSNHSGYSSSEHVVANNEPTGTRNANESDEYECLSFDLEKTRPLPRISTSMVFYKCQLWVYRGYCYVWVEGTAGRGAQEKGKHTRTKLSAE